MLELQRKTKQRISRKQSTHLVERLVGDSKRRKEHAEAMNQLKELQEEESLNDLFRPVLTTQSRNTSRHNAYSRDNVFDRMERDISRRREKENSVEAIKEFVLERLKVPRCFE